MNAASTPQSSPPGQEVARTGHKFIATDDQRAKVRQLAKLFPRESYDKIAIQIGCSVDTLTRHFRYELDIGLAEMLTTVASQMVNRAIDAEAKGPDGKLLAKGDLDAQKFVLARLGKWSTKVEHSDAPPPTEAFDATRLTPEEREALRPLLEKALGAREDEEGIIDIEAEPSDGPA